MPWNLREEKDLLAQEKVLLSRSRPEYLLWRWFCWITKNPSLKKLSFTQKSYKIPGDMGKE